MNKVQLILSHRERMSRYYALHSKIYDLTRWMFLFGRSQIICDLVVRPGETVVEIGCGTGRNFQPLLTRLEGRGRLIGVDCSKPMLVQAANRIRRNKWRNVEIVDHEYGPAPLIAGEADVVLLSYSLSMTPNWHRVLKSAKAELKPGGRIGLVDFIQDELHQPARLFADWLRLNHVEIDRPYDTVLTSFFETQSLKTSSAFGGLWSYLRFVGTRSATPKPQHSRMPAKESRNHSTSLRSHVCTRF